MKGLRVLFSLTLAAGVLTAQPQQRRPPAGAANGNQPGNPAPDNTPSLKPGSVEGVVTNAVNGGPVKKATVTLRSNQGFAYAAITDIAGHFLVDKVEPGRYTASATRDGFTPDMTRRGALRSINVAEEQHVTDVTVKLTPLGSITGRVLDDEGEPIADASVQLMRAQYSLGRKQFLPQAVGNSNDLGEYQMLDIQPGRYYVQAMIRPRGNNSIGRIRREHGEEAYPATYYPNAMEIGQASPLEVTAGGTLGNIDFRMKKTLSYHVHGKVVDQNGQPARNVNIQAHPASSVANFSPVALFGMVQPDGSFDIGPVNPGSYSITSQRQEAGVTVFAKQPVSVSDQDVDGVLLTLAPGIDISGTTIIEGNDTAPPPGQGQSASQQATAQQSRGQVMLQTTERMIRMPRAPVETDGTFVLHDVMPATYQINVAGTAGKYLKTIRFADHDVPSGQIEVGQQGTGSLQLIFGADGGQIEGTVQNKSGDSAVAALIMVAPREEFEGRSDLFKQAMTDQSGHFKVQDVAPGSYKVFAWEDADRLTAGNPEVRKVFESRAASVTIGANSRESIQLKSISAEDVTAEKGKLP